MRRLPALALLGPLLGLLTLLAGCSLFYRRPLVLCTDRPELASFVEQFNARQADLRVQLRYQSSPEEALRRDQGVDLLIGSRLAGAGELRALESLEDLFRARRLARGDFYAPLLAAGAPERRQVLLPLSFCLPAVVFLGLSGVTTALLNSRRVFSFPAFRPSVSIIFRSSLVLVRLS